MEDPVPFSSFMLTTVDDPIFEIAVDSPRNGLKEENEQFIFEEIEAIDIVINLMP